MSSIVNSIVDQAFTDLGSTTVNSFRLYELDQNLEKMQLILTQMVEEALKAYRFPKAMGKYVVARVVLSSPEYSPTCSRKETRYEIEFPALFLSNGKDPCFFYYQERVIKSHDPVLSNILDLISVMNRFQSLFIEAVKFILYHEIAHIYLGHCDVVRDYMISKDRISFEENADKVACMYLGSADGAIFFLENIQQIFPNYNDPLHPPIRERISYLKKLFPQ